MKKIELRQIIKEEISKILEENPPQNILTQEDINNIHSRGFDINKSKGGIIWIERQQGIRSVNFKYIENLLNSKNIPFRVDFWRGDGDKGRSKEIWIDDPQYLDPNISYPKNSLAIKMGF
jgi:hypothetical protein